MDEGFVKGIYAPGRMEADHAIQVLQDYIERSTRQCKNAREMVDNWNKDEEIAKRDKEIEELRTQMRDATLLPFPKYCRRNAKDFYLEHCKLGHNPYFQFTPTQISMCCEVVCTCGKRFTTYD